MPPGWYPKENGGFQAPPAIDHNTYTKFNLIVSSKLGAYLLVQFGFLLAFTAYFLFTYAANAELQNGLQAAFILVSLLLIGGLLENRKWAIWAEIPRLCMYVVLLHPANSAGGALLVLGTVISAGIFMFIQSSKNNPIEA